MVVTTVTKAVRMSHVMLLWMLKFQRHETLWTVSYLQTQICLLLEAPCKCECRSSRYPSNSSSF
jgi:hypothetical protein